MNELTRRLSLAALIAGVVGLAPGCSSAPEDDDTSPTAATPTEGSVDGTPTATAVPDSDEDGIANGDDNCAYVANPTQQNSDGDSYGDACDIDDDNDGVDDELDNCPRTANPDQLDADSDGLGNACDTATTAADTDGDGVDDGEDNCPLYVNADQADFDGDDVGDPCDADDDGDGISDEVDNCPRTANADQSDGDQDGVGDACDVGADIDGDGVVDGEDNCPFVPNADQADEDGNDVGDACEQNYDRDGDGVEDLADNCPLTANADQADADGDGVGDACESQTDADGDGVDDIDDNCPQLINPSQADLDGDAIGDACDDDTDGDGVVNGADNCALTANSDQADADADGLGDACELVADSDLDGVTDLADNCPVDANTDQADADGDGLGDECDPITTVPNTFGDAFPGSQITEHMVSTDGRAFANSGDDGKIVHGMNVFWNGETGTAIILYTDYVERLWAHYYDGENFGPAVNLVGPNMGAGYTARDMDEDFRFFENAWVLFLNTDASGNANAAARDGDALIVWNHGDQDPDPSLGGSDDSNRRLYGTYFDVSESGAALTDADDTVRWGFETEAVVIDYDNTVSGNDDDVLSAGFASDSLIRTHDFPEREDSSSSEFDNTNAYLYPASRSGDPTTYAHILWMKGQNEGSSETGFGASLHSLAFDLTQEGNALPVEESLGAAALPLQGGLEPVSTPTYGGFIVHNGDVIWHLETTSEATFLLHTRFGTGAASTSALGQIGEGNAYPDLPHAEDVYGADHGLGATYAIYQQEGDLVASWVDGAGDVENALLTDGDIEGGLTTLYGTRINRTSRFLGVLFTGTFFQPQSKTSRVSAAAQSGVETVYAGALQLTLDGETTRDAASSWTGAQEVPNQVESQNARWVHFQRELATGVGDPRLNIQSNAARLNFLIEDIDGEDTGLAALIHNGMVISGNGAGAPSLAFALTDAYPSGRLDMTATSYALPYAPTRTSTPGQYTTYNWSGYMHPAMVDLGDASGAGLVYYLRNANNPTDTEAEDAFNEPRLYGVAAVSGATPQLISTNGQLDDQTINGYFAEVDDYEYSYDDPYRHGELLRVKTTPANMDTSGSPSHGGDAMHLFFQEARYGRTSSAALRTRRFDKTAYSAASDATSFTTAHTPSLAGPPMSLTSSAELDFIKPHRNDVDSNSSGPRTAFVTADGDSLGLYWMTEAHFVYQEYDGDAWLTEGGLPDAQLIDNVSGGGIFPGRDQQAYAFPPMVEGSANTFNGTLVFYAKSLQGDDIGHRRYQARIHD